MSASKSTCNRPFRLRPSICAGAVDMQNAHITYTRERELVSMLRLLEWLCKRCTCVRQTNLALLRQPQRAYSPYLRPPAYGGHRPSRHRGLLPLPELLESRRPTATSLHQRWHHYRCSARLVRLRQSVQPAPVLSGAAIIQTDHRDKCARTTKMECQQRCLQNAQVRRKRSNECAPAAQPTVQVRPLSAEALRSLWLLRSWMSLLPAQQRTTATQAMISPGARLHP